MTPPVVNPAANANDVYRRYHLSWANIPDLVTPSTHSDEMELYCAMQSQIAYAVYPGMPHAPDHDYIPSELRELIAGRALAVGGFFGEDGAVVEESGSFEGGQGYRTVTTDRAGALLVWKQDHLVVAFRGTANWQDWIYNLERGEVSADFLGGHGDLCLHKGFTGLAENIAPAVFEMIADFLKFRSKRSPVITFCGHSLGGALALNVAAKIHRLRDHMYYDEDSDYYEFGELGFLRCRVGATYTFGAPRIGKGPVWDFIRRPHYRLVVRGDVVPSFPLLSTEDFTPTYLEFHDRPAVQPVGFFNLALKAALIQISSKIGVIPAAHNIESYISAINRKIGAAR